MPTNLRLRLQAMAGRGRLEAWATGISPPPPTLSMPCAFTPDVMRSWVQRLQSLLTDHFGKELVSLRRSSL